MSNVCQYCGKELHGRPDKKFCDNRCRNSYHNLSKNEYSNIRHKTDNILKRNYNILSGLINRGITSVDILEMEQFGFRPSFVTTIRQGRQNYREFACYDIVYCQTSSRIFNIRRCGLLGSGLSGRRTDSAF